DEVDALPRALGVGAIGGPQKQTRDELDHDRVGQRAAPDVPPAGAAGDPLVQRRLEDVAVPGPMIEPVEESPHTIGTLCSWPGWKFWKRTHTSSPFRISTSSSSIARGLGLAGSAIVPSRANWLRWQGQAKCVAPGARSTKHPAWGQTTLRLWIPSGARVR